MNPLEIVRNIIGAGKAGVEVADETVEAVAPLVVAALRNMGAEGLVGEDVLAAAEEAEAPVSSALSALPSLADRAVGDAITGTQREFAPQDASRIMDERRGRTPPPPEPPEERYSPGDATREAMATRRRAQEAEEPVDVGVPPLQSGIAQAVDTGVLGGLGSEALSLARKATPIGAFHTPLEAADRYVQEGLEANLPQNQRARAAGALAGMPGAVGTSMLPMGAATKATQGLSWLPRGLALLAAETGLGTASAAGSRNEGDVRGQDLLEGATGVITDDQGRAVGGPMGALSVLASPVVGGAIGGGFGLARRGLHMLRDSNMGMRGMGASAEQVVNLQERLGREGLARQFGEALDSGLRDAVSPFGINPEKARTALNRLSGQATDARQSVAREADQLARQRSRGPQTVQATLESDLPDRIEATDITPDTRPRNVSLEVEALDPPEQVYAPALEEVLEEYRAGRGSETIPLDVAAERDVGHRLANEHASMSGAKDMLLTPDNPEALRFALRNQEALRRSGFPETMRLYRSVSGPEAELLMSGQMTGQESQRGLQSWTWDPAMAASWSGEEVIAADVPIEDVYAHGAVNMETLPSEFEVVLRPRNVRPVSRHTPDEIFEMFPDTPWRRYVGGKSSWWDARVGDTSRPGDRAITDMMAVQGGREPPDAGGDRYINRGLAERHPYEYFESLGDERLARLHDDGPQGAVDMSLRDDEPGAALPRIWSTYNLLNMAENGQIGVVDPDVGGTLMGIDAKTAIAASHFQALLEGGGQFTDLTSGGMTKILEDAGMIRQVDGTWPPKFEAVADLTPYRNVQLVPLVPRPEARTGHVYSPTPRGRELMADRISRGQRRSPAEATDVTPPPTPENVEMDVIERPPPTTEDVEMLTEMEGVRFEPGVPRSALDEAGAEGASYRGLVDEQGQPLTEAAAADVSHLRNLGQRVPGEGAMSFESLGDRLRKLREDLGVRQTATGVQPTDRQAAQRAVSGFRRRGLEAMGEQASPELAEQFERHQDALSLYQSLGPRDRQHLGTAAAVGGQAAVQGFPRAGAYALARGVAEGIPAYIGTRPSLLRYQQGERGLLSGAEGLATAGAETGRLAQPTRAGARVGVSAAMREGVPSPGGADGGTMDQDLSPEEAGAVIESVRSRLNEGQSQEPPERTEERLRRVKERLGGTAP